MGGGVTNGKVLALSWVEVHLPILGPAGADVVVVVVVVAPTAKMVKMGAWLLHFNRWQGSACHKR